MTEFMFDPLKYYPWSAQNTDYPLWLGTRMSRFDAKAQSQLPIEFEPAKPSLLDGVVQEPVAPPYMRFYGAIWPDFRDRLVRAWSAINGDITRSLEKWGMSIAFYDQMSDLYAEHVTAFPGRPGLFTPSDKKIVMSQRTTYAHGFTVPAIRLGRTLYHEVGHAIDYCFGDLSRQPGFVKAHCLDADSIDDAETRWKLSYFLDSEDSVSEAFAEGWAEQSTCVNQTYTSEVFRKSFPRVLEWIASNVPSADHGFALPKEALTKRDLAGRTPLRILWHNLELPQLRKLMMQGANPLARTDYFGETILEQVFREKRLDYLKVMLDHIIENPALAVSQAMAERLDRCFRWNENIRNSPDIADALAKIKVLIAERGIGPDTDGLDEPPARDIIWNIPRKKKNAE